MRVTSTSSSQYPAVYSDRGIYQLIHWCNNCPSACHTTKSKHQYSCIALEQRGLQTLFAKPSLLQPFIPSQNHTLPANPHPAILPKREDKKKISSMRALQLLRRPLHTSPLPATVSTQSASCFSSSSPGRLATDNPNADSVSNASRDEHKTGDDHPARQPDPQAQPTRSTGFGGQTEVKGGKEGLGGRSDRASSSCGESGRGKGEARR